MALKLFDARSVRLQPTSGSCGQDRQTGTRVHEFDRATFSAGIIGIVA